MPVHAMTLPRLRVRELLFLVVYAALIGQAFVLGLTDRRIVSAPSGVEGYVWVPASEFPFLDVGDYLNSEYVDIVGKVWEWRPSEPFTVETLERMRGPKVYSDPRFGRVLLIQSDDPSDIATLEAIGHPSPRSRETLYHLVPEELLK